MIKIIFGFISGAIYGMIYMAGEPNIVISNIATLIKTLL